jgi:signal transduction protein with GAF and PtsI domain
MSENELTFRQAKQILDGKAAQFKAFEKLKSVLDTAARAEAMMAGLEDRCEALRKEAERPSGERDKAKELAEAASKEGDAMVAKARESARDRKRKVTEELKIAEDVARAKMEAINEQAASVETAFKQQKSDSEAELAQLQKQVLDTRKTLETMQKRLAGVQSGISQAVR